MEKKELLVVELINVLLFKSVLTLSWHHMQPNAEAIFSNLFAFIKAIQIETELRGSPEVFCCQIFVVRLIILLCLLVNLTVYEVFCNKYERLKLNYYIFFMIPKSREMKNQLINIH